MRRRGCYGSGMPPRGRTATSSAAAKLPAGASLVGRELERQRLVEHFEGGAQLVTVVAPGGMGKTSLAQAFAEEQRPHYAAHGGGGAWFCDLTQAVTPMGAHSVIAAELSIALSGSDDAAMAKALGAALARKKRTLLVLDNVEQLLPHERKMFAVWMREAPAARLLVTSRTALGLPGEVLLPLAPLPLHDAVTLLARRASEVRPGFSGDDQRALCEAIVERIDRVPLAIELAASRLRVLGPEQLLTRLGQPLELLVRRGDEGRHGSMRRVLTASLEQLPASDRRCLAALTVFHGGFTLEAAEQVLAADRAIDVLASLEALVAHALLGTRESGGALRFFMLESIRELAAAGLDDDTRDSLRQAHANHFVAGCSRFRAERRSALFVHVGGELDNLLAAHDTLRASAGADVAGGLVELARVIVPVFMRRGQVRMAMRLLDEVAASPVLAQAPPGALGELSLMRAGALRELGDLNGALRAYEASSAASLDGGERELAALAWARAAELTEIEGRTAEAREQCRRALAEVGERLDGRARDVAAEAHARIAHTLRREGALDEAERHIALAVEHLRALGDDDGLSLALYEAFVIALIRARYEDALARFEEAIVLARAIGARRTEGALLSGRGLLHQERGDLADAIEDHRAAVSLFRAIGNPHREASALFYLGAACLERWQLSDASAVLGEALARIREIGAPRYTVLIEATLAVLAAVAERGDEARTRLGRAREASVHCPSEPGLHAFLEVMSAAIRVATGEATSAAILPEAEATARRHENDDTRFALRVLRRTGGRREGAVVDEAPFVVRADGRGFRLPGAQRDVDLSRRAPLQRILRALALRRIEAPGAPLDLGEIIGAGWPGERIAERAANNRVHVALTTLRKLGLRDMLVAEAGGYALRPVGAFVLE